MIYQFEHEEVDICNNCPMCIRVIDTEGCMLTKKLISGSKTPQENDCPLVAISKTETTSARALSCWYCTEIEKHGVVAVKTVLDKAGRELDACETPYNYCPNCGRRLEENEDDISV